MCNKMSDVRLSNASPTLERVDARQPDNVRAPVQRNLFGLPDREEIRRYLTAAIQEDVQHFRAEYNFDPVSERPLTPHSYEWQEDSDAPEFYRRPPHRSERPQRGVDSSGNGRLDAEGGQPNANGTRKRRPGESGSCSDESKSKRSHTDDDNDDDDDEGQRDGAGGQASTATEGGPSRTENCAEVQ